MSAHAIVSPTRLCVNTVDRWRLSAFPLAFPLNPFLGAGKAIPGVLHWRTLEVRMVGPGSDEKDIKYDVQWEQGNGGQHSETNYPLWQRGRALQVVRKRADERKKV